MSEQNATLSYESVFAQVAMLMGKVFGLDPAKITGATTPADIPRWDSLNMLTVLLGVERRLGVVVPPEALDDIHDVNGIVGEILNRAGEAA